MTRPFTTNPIKFDGVRGLREADDGTMSSGVTESLDLDGFQWTGQNDRYAQRSNMQIYINKSGRITVSAAAMAALGDIPRDDQGWVRVLLGLAPAALAIRCVAPDTPRACALREQRTGKGRVTNVIANKAFVAQLTEAGLELPAVLDVKVYPDLKVLFAKLPKKEGAK